MEATFHATEWAALRALDGVLPIPTPSPRERFVLDGWHGLVMSRLQGEELAERWTDIPLDNQIDLGREVGEALSVLHEQEPPPEIPRVDWPRWVAERESTLVDTQRARGCREDWLEQIPSLLKGSDLRAGPMGWLHTEIMREHLLVERVADRWRLSGVFDFEPSWVGPRDYELCSVGLFVSGGQSKVFGAVLERLRREKGPALPPRCLAMTLMHRYCNLPWYARRLGTPEGSTLLDCAEQWFGC